MQKRNKILSIFYLGRFFESSLIGATGAIEFIMLGEINLLRVGSIAIASFFMMVGIYAWNDVLDIQEDTISHPERPIPNGEISMKQAKVMGSISFMLATIVFWFLNTQFIPLFILGSIVGVFYSKTTKHITFGKTTTVLVTAMVGALAVAWVELGKLNNTIFAFTLSISLLLFGYEILKDMRDVSGDSQVGIKTIPMMVGFQKSTLIAGTSFSASCFSIGIFFLTKGFLFESVISLITGILIVPAFVRLYHQPKTKIIDLVRLFAIGTIGVSLNIVTISLYLRQPA